MMRGKCSCGNIKFDWQNIDASLVPRTCQCLYCRNNNLTYVSKSGTRLSITIKRPQWHLIEHQGTGTADFHRCRFCNDVVLVTAVINNETFGVINRHCVQNVDFPPPVALDFAEETREKRCERRFQNWCTPVIFH